MQKFLFFLLFMSTVLLFSEWTIMATYELPEGASGLAFDGEYLYCGIYGANGDEIYQIDRETGDYSLVSSGLLEDAFGLSYDGNYFWTIKRLGAYEPSNAIQFDLAGNIISQFELPTTYMSGIAFDEGNFWVAAYYDPDGHIYKLDSEGNILVDFPAPDNQPWDLCLENGNLWMADYWGDAIYKINPETGEMVESYESEGTDASGIVYDGEFLWYCDNGSDYSSDFLYKIDLGGAGTPDIHLEISSLEFGDTIIGETESLAITIHNIGTAELVIDEFIFPAAEFFSEEDFPIVIEANGEQQVELFFAPQNWGLSEGDLQILSNDPLEPEKNVWLSGYGLFEEQKLVTDAQEIPFGEVRIHSQTGRFIEISNQGNQELVITNMDVSNSFYLENITYPITLLPKETFSLRIWFSAETTGTFESEIVIESNDFAEPEIFVPVSALSVEVNTDFGEMMWHFSTNQEQEKVVALKQFIDITGDDIPEILIADNRYHLYCVNGNSSGEADILWQFSSAIDEIGWGSIYDKRGIYVADDLNGDEISDVVIGTAWGSRSVFALCGATGEIIWHYDTHQFGEGGWVYQVEAKRDFNLDGVSDVLAVAGDDGNGTGPKAVFLLDGTDGSIIWHHQFSVAQSSVISIPTVDYDGTPEVICGDSSEGNNAKIHYLNSAGQEGFYYNTNSLAVWALAEIQDITNDSMNDIAYGTFSGTVGTLTYEMNPIWNFSVGNAIITRLETRQQNGNEYLIPVVNGTNLGKIFETTQGDVISTYYTNGNLLSVESISDIDGDDFFDIVTGTLANTLQVFSGDTGEEINFFNFSHPVDQVLAINDINQTGNEDIIVGLRNGQVYCISSGETETSAENHALAANQVGSIQGIFPNPFNPKLTISYQIEKESHIELVVFNAKGQKIAVLLDEHLPAGPGKVVWFGKDEHGSKVGSGVYFISIMQQGKIVDVKKSILLK